MDAKRGDWVRIHKTMLSPAERAPQVPGDTKEVPLEMWDKGFLLNEEASCGDTVEVETIIGRRVSGELLERNPQFDHAWGRCIPEILHIGRRLRSILDGEESHDGR